MKKIKESLFKNEAGLTLVEVLASIVILSIVLLLFLLTFLQFMNTSRQSEEVITATYLAQTEMESLYEMSREIDRDERKSNLQMKGYANIGLENDWDIFEKEVNDEDYDERYIMRIKFQERDDQLTRVIVEISDFLNTHPKAQMENLLEWKVTENE